jgi:SAM-dependent methyltransferase
MTLTSATPRFNFTRSNLHRVEAREMEAFWDRRADEDPFHFVDNRQPYRAPDLDEFWRSGDDALERIEATLGAAISAGDEVVEIGCGVGRLTRALAARGARVLALDVSSRMLDRARQLNPGLAGVEWIHGDGKSLQGIGSASVDVCLSFVVFQHIPDPSVTLGYVHEMGRVLRPGGFAAFQVSNRPEVHRPPSIASRARAAAARSFRGGPGGQADPEWLGSAVELGALRDAVETAGMKVERVTGEGSQYCLVLARKRPAE